MTWNALLLVYRELDVRLNIGRDSEELLVSRRFHHILTEQEIADALESFEAFPELVEELTGGSARVTSRIEFMRRRLRSLTVREKGEFWPSPDDTRCQLDQFAPPGNFESIFIFWPQHDFSAATSVPSKAWGLGMGSSAWSNGATYATVANAPTPAWRNEGRGEVWLHEWLHGVCHHFAQRGHVMPERDADGAELHGYVRSPTRGWTDYYRDLMNGNVQEVGHRVGIPATAWNEFPNSPRIAVR